MKKELVSIIMPVFNRGNLIAESLDSIFQQQYKNWECIVVDDHSTDDTWNIVKGYVQKDERFRLYKRPESKNKGANSCRNYGLELAKGEYIHWFDSDDIAHPRCLMISKTELDKSGLSFCRFNREIFFGEFDYSFFEDISEQYEISKIGRNNLEAMLKNELEFNTCNVLWKRESLKDEGFNENIVYADEWEFYSRLLAKGLEGVSIDKTLFFGRKHSESTTFEFLSADTVRRDSKIKASLLVIKNLGNRNLLSDSLADSFIKLGFFLKSSSIIKLTLQNSKASFLKSLKYRLGYTIYPLLRPIFKIKGKFKN